MRCHIRSLTERKRVEKYQSINLLERKIKEKKKHTKLKLKQMKIKNKQWRRPRKNYYEHIRDAIGLVLVKARTWREKKTRTQHNTMHALG